MERIADIGAGAMGCLFAAHLALSGADVTVVDVDDERLRLLDAEGILLEDELGVRKAAVSASLAANTKCTFDLLILFTKGMHSSAAIRSVAHLNDGQCHVLTLQNGLGNVEAICEVFSPDLVLWGVTDFPADLEGPNRVTSRGAGHVWLDGVTPAGSTYAQKLADLLNSSELSTIVEPNVSQIVWEKVAFNAALNSLATINRTSVGGLDCPEGRRIASLVAEEAIATAAAIGVLLNRERVFGKIDFALANHRTHKPSMLQDRLAGRMTEIESINGAVVRIARQANVPTPATQILADLVRMGEYHALH